MTAEAEREQEANYFAMHLLVPSDMLRAEVAKLGGFDLCDDRSGVLRRLARKFQVSDAIIAFRMAEEANNRVSHE